MTILQLSTRWGALDLWVSNSATYQVCSRIQLLSDVLTNLFPL